jgi:hypothetical protein
VDKGPLDARQLLEFDLQVFSNVVGHLETLVPIDDDVHFGHDTRAAVIGSDSVDALNEGRVRHGCEAYCEWNAKNARDTSFDLQT